LKDVGIIFYLKKMAKWMELEEFVFWIVEREDIDEKVKGMGDLVREMWRGTNCYLKGKVERLVVIGEEVWPCRECGGFV
jgi:hypothetical protein